MENPTTNHLHWKESEQDIPTFHFWFAFFLDDHYGYLAHNTCAVVFPKKDNCLIICLHHTWFPSDVAFLQAKCIPQFAMRSAPGATFIVRMQVDYTAMPFDKLWANMQ